jgi:branched-subunit amino acid transport protein
MSEAIQVLIVAVTLYAIKTLPLMWRIVPRTPLADRIFDLLPVAMLMAMLLPPVLRPLFNDLSATGGWLALAALASTFATCLLTNRAALGIGVGLAILAVAELL